MVEFVGARRIFDAMASAAMDPREIERELREFLGKRFGGAVQLAGAMKVALKGRDKEAFTPPPDSPRNAAAKVDTPDFRPGDGESH